MAIQIFFESGQGGEAQVNWFGKKDKQVPKWRQREEQEEKWSIYVDVQEAHAEWVRARLQFEEALGQDQIDYAIYMLEAAERKYQMHLKRAKHIGLNMAQAKDSEVARVAETKQETGS